MHLSYMNVNAAFNDLVCKFHYSEIPITVAPSRNGDVIMATQPMTITYLNPKQRVLFNEARDCNPFFHLFESLWILAGRDDVAPLKYFVSTINEFSDTGFTFNGAYGQRLRYFHRIDQIKEAIAQLKHNPNSRRVVLQMWTLSDMMKADNRHGTMSKDVPCNTHAYVSINPLGLELTVCNRSNDMIWGMLGANVVHFSFLQEYLAACIGVPVNVYNQFTNNLHVYRSNWKPDEWLSDRTEDLYSMPRVLRAVPLVKDVERFNYECAEFIDLKEDGVYQEPFLNDVAVWACLGYRHHKNREYPRALEAVSRIESDDWRVACRRWLERRSVAWRKKNGDVERAESCDNAEA